MHAKDVEIVNDKQKKVSLPKTGKILCMARKLTNQGPQSKVIQELKKRGLFISQSLLAKYETGSIFDPDVNVLKFLTDLYSIPYEVLLKCLVEEKYGMKLGGFEEMRSVLGEKIVLEDPLGFLSGDDE